MSARTSELRDAARLEKVALTRRIGQFLHNQGISHEERSTVENVARALAQDLSVQVREVLAFELRTCPSLPHDLAARIATDVESVAGPFLAATPVFSDDQLASLIPHLAGHAHISLSRRGDLGDKAIYALVSIAGEEAVTYIVRNEKLDLPERAVDKIINRFRASTGLMERLAERTDLPLMVIDELITLVSDSYRALLTERYNLGQPIADRLIHNSHHDVLWTQIRYASPNQIHAFVIDLKGRGRLSETLVIDMADRGAVAFLESAAALESGLTLGAVRDIFRTGDMKEFVRLMQQAGFTKDGAARCHRIITAHNRLTGQGNS